MRFLPRLSLRDQEYWFCWWSLKYLLYVHAIISHVTEGRDQQMLKIHLYGIRLSLLQVFLLCMIWGALT